MKKIIGKERKSSCSLYGLMNLFFVWLKPFQLHHRLNGHLSLPDLKKLFPGLGLCPIYIVNLLNITMLTIPL